LFNQIELETEMWIECVEPLRAPAALSGFPRADLSRGAGWKEGFLNIWNWILLNIWNANQALWNCVPINDLMKRWIFNKSLRIAKENKVKSKIKTKQKYSYEFCFWKFIRTAPFFSLFRAALNKMANMGKQESKVMEKMSKISNLWN
jgi:hypothetical protein